MAAKKRGGGGSSPGLVITLVFFILSTIGLGVATYYGFAEQTALEKKAKDAVVDAERTKAERNWYKLRGDVYRAYMTEPPKALDMKEVARQKADLDANRLILVTALKQEQDKESVKETQAYLAELKKEDGLGWDATKEEAPPLTWRMRLKNQDNAYLDVEKRLGTLAKEKAAETKVAADARKEADDARKEFGDAIKRINDKDGIVTKHRTEYEEALTRVRATLVESGKTLTEVRQQKAEAEAKLAAAEKDRDKFKKDLTAKTVESKNRNDEVNRLMVANRSLKDRLRSEGGAEDTELQSAKATEKLKTWNKDWKVVSVERLGTVQRPLTYAYINLGENQRVMPQLTFSVHPVEPSGRLSPTPRGTIEVVRVVKPNLALALVTSEKDAKADPIRKGDRLFNAVWDPTERKRVAIVGLIDVAGDGTDGTSEFMRGLRRQGIQVDAYLDMDTLKVKGKGITAKTDYLIVGNGIEGTRHPKARDTKFVAEATKAMTALKTQARNLNVPMIDLDRYMQATGIAPSGRGGEGRPVGEARPPVGGGGLGRPGG